MSPVLRRLWAVVVTVGLVLAVAVVPANAVGRVQGETAVDTAVAVSEHYFRSAETVLVSRVDGFADALAGASLAGLRGAPILFVDHDAVPSVVHREIRRLGADDVIVLGGPAAVSDRVVRALGGRRIAGENRYQTAAAIGRAVDQQRSTTQVFLATGAGYADAVAVAALAARQKAPILLTERDRLPQATRDALRAIDPDRVQIVGGESVVSAGVARAVRDMGFEVPARLAGSTRYNTSADIVQASIASGLRSTHRLVVSGEGYADALAAAPAAGLTNRVLAIAPRDNLGPAPLAGAGGCDIDQVEVVGGTSALSEIVVERLARAEAGDCSGDPGPDEPWFTEFVESRLDEALDGRRRDTGRSAVARADDLDRTARDWSLQMARENRLRHNPDLGQQVCCFDRVGENVGNHVIGGSGEVTADDLKRAAADLHAAWLASSSHRRNIDDPGWDEIGVGVVVRGDRVWVTFLFRDRA